MIVFKDRYAYWCNIKLFLLYLTVVGHLLEPLLSFSIGARFLYELIYSFHMPLFAFVSGIFIKSSHHCVRQAKTAIKGYLLWQGLYIAVSVFVIKKPFSIIALLTPYWHLWYLLSLCFWCTLSWIYFFISDRCRPFKKPAAKLALFILFIFIGCMCGRYSSINRIFSLSRTLVFFPYFMLGTFCPADLDLKPMRKYFPLPFAAGAFLFYRIKSETPLSFWYQAAPVDFSGGEYFRLLSYICAICMGTALLLITPRKNFYCTKIGADTMMIYILHAPLVLMAGKFYFLSPFYGLSVPVLSLIFIFGIYAAFAWKASLFRFKGGDGHSGVSRRL